MKYAFHLHATLGKKESNVSTPNCDLRFFNPSHFQPSPINVDRQPRSGSNPKMRIAKKGEVVPISSPQITNVMFKIQMMKILLYVAIRDFANSSERSPSPPSDSRSCSVRYPSQGHTGEARRASAGSCTIQGGQRLNAKGNQIRRGIASRPGSRRY